MKWIGGILLVLVGYGGVAVAENSQQEAEKKAFEQIIDDNAKVRLAAAEKIWAIQRPLTADETDRIYTSALRGTDAPFRLIVAYIVRKQMSGQFDHSPIGEGMLLRTAMELVWDQKLIGMSYYYGGKTGFEALIEAMAFARHQYTEVVHTLSAIPSGIADIKWALELLSTKTPWVPLPPPYGCPFSRLGASTGP